MGTVVTPLQSLNIRSRVAAGLVTQPSRLLRSLFSELDGERRITVLEVGPIAQETVGFFSQFPSRLHVLNLFEEAALWEQPEECEVADLKRAFLERMGFPRGTLIDICLFWDFLNYLTPPMLRAFDAALRPYVHGGTRAHGFSVLNVETPLSNRQYGLVNPDTICSRPARVEQLDYYPHTHEELNACMASFRVSRGWLLADGRLEMLLETRV